MNKTSRTTNRFYKDHLDTYYNHPDLSGVRKALVVYCKNIGDVILATPVFSVLKNRYPNMIVDALVNKETEEILLGNPHINQIISYDRARIKATLSSQIRGEVALFSSIRKQGYDMVISLASSNRGRTLSWLSGAKITVGCGRQKKIFFGRIDPHTHWVRHTAVNRHYLELHLDSLRRIGIFPGKEEKYPQLFEGEAARNKILGLLDQAGLNDKPFILIHPTSRWMFKCWPSQSMAQLITRIHKEIKLPVILTAAPDPNEAAYMEHLQTELDVPVVDLAGQLSLRELIALVRMAQLFIGVDSAPMHMASATRTPTVALFGPSNEVDWGPIGDNHTVVASPRLICRPCQIDGCGGGKVSECMLDISVEEVFSQVQDSLNQ